ncbi:hypothetical protein AAFF_G00118300 [Aldrovandia affinis]|uniref:G-protein coupled receptors family 1 profile domain-containing protein n=1 Tax=Aldrovandia affinis TaxID=143900 RepID=A0AAD7WAK6_9TELE|nr:hypothetical protein AAFF_G00118300 [Aldrovandia affinis]
MGIGIMNDSCPENPPETTRCAVFATVYSFVLLVGLPLNVLSLWIILKRHGLRSSNTVLMANLALSDLVLTLSLPLRIYYYATATWPFGAVACIVNSMMFFVNIVSSSVIITFISVDRMLAIAFPLRSRKLRSPRSSGMACAAMWILLISYYLANARGIIKKTYECDGKFCFDMSKWQKNTHIGIAIMILTLLTPTKTPFLHFVLPLITCSQLLFEMGIGIMNDSCPENPPETTSVQLRHHHLHQRGPNAGDCIPSALSEASFSQVFRNGLRGHVDPLNLVLYSKCQRHHQKNLRVRCSQLLFEMGIGIMNDSCPENPPETTSVQLRHHHLHQRGPNAGDCIPSALSEASFSQVFRNGLRGHVDPLNPVLSSKCQRQHQKKYTQILKVQILKRNRNTERSQLLFEMGIGIMNDSCPENPPETTSVQLRHHHLHQRGPNAGDCIPSVLSEASFSQVFRNGLRGHVDPLNPVLSSKCQRQHQKKEGRRDKWRGLSGVPVPSPGLGTLDSSPRL